MSFANYDLEAQKAAGASDNQINPDGTNELDTIISKTSRQLQNLSSSISQLENQRKQIGTKRDSQLLRDNLNNLITQVTDLESAVQKLIANIVQLINQNVKDDETSKLKISNKQLILKDRLVSEFNDLHKQFQKCLRLYAEKKASFPIKSQDVVDESTPLIASQGRTQPQQQLQQQVDDEETINQTELQYHILLTEERNREIEQVSQGITEINSIFKDLGQLVSQQGENLDTIEDNILQLHGNTQQADKQLRVASEYQRKKGKWSCILLTTLAIIVLVIVLAVVS
jgi:syntaxin 7